MCTYMLEKNSYGHTGIDISNVFMKNVDVSVYKMNEKRGYDYIGNIYDGEDHRFEVDNYDYLYILVTPQNGKIGSFQIYANVYGGGLSGGAIAGIVLGSVAF